MRRVHPYLAPNDSSGFSIQWRGHGFSRLRSVGMNVQQEGTSLQYRRQKAVNVDTSVNGARS